MIHTEFSIRLQHGLMMEMNILVFFGALLEVSDMWNLVSDTRSCKNCFVLVSQILKAVLNGKCVCSF